MAKKTTKNVSARAKVTKKSTKKTVPKASKKTPKKQLAVSFRQKILLMVGVSMIALGFGVWTWWNSILMNPDRALNDMLANSLQTSGITKTISQDTASQSVRLYFQPNPMAQTSTVLTQQGQTGTTSSVTTETIGTKTADYVRYTDINTGGTTTPGIEEIINVWASQKADERIGVKPAFLNEASLSIIPFGNLSDSDAGKVLSAMQEKQLYSYEKSATKWRDGRPTLIYSISVKPSDLISVLKIYSEVTGIGDSRQLRSEDYASLGDLKIEIAVDAFSRQLLNVNYPDSGRNELYSGYGLKNLVDLPENPIGISELQTKIQNLSRQLSQ